ncbi:hypoxia inducible factor 1 subunit alpha, like [Echeneis naucrates]|uniref:hypoxia inducible factor 1 subunit alpha, like n=1 Tax=Echeneis naucrates TaxID=173247 RepID=UPI001113B3BF|nr:hypoxia-inducible factor 1-alpha-like [Echeneis naucrates]
MMKTMFKDNRENKLLDMLIYESSSKKFQQEQQRERNFFLRMKTTLTSRGRTVNIKSATWKVLHCTGHIGPFGDSFTSPTVGRVMTLLCEPVPHPFSVEFPLDTWTFLTRDSMDLRFTHCEGRVTELVGYKSDDLIGRSAYEFHHALDSKHVNKSLHTLLSKGQVSTSIYRFLANSGGFVWVETQATILYSSKTSQPEAIVCLNFILSAVEQPDVVFSLEQIRLQKSEPQSPALPPVYHGMSVVCDSGSELVTSLLKSKPCQNKDADLSPSSPSELIQVPCEAEDPDVLPPGGFVELSFVSKPSPNSLPDHPQNLCTPQLRQLLMPIFSPVTPPSTSSWHSELDEDEELMDANKVEKFFAIRSDGQNKDETLEMLEGMDLDMLAPYISMDDDFQLTFLNSLPEKAEKPSFLPESTLVSRKRSHNLSGDESSQLIGQDKRQKQDPFSVGELILSHRLLPSRRMYLYTVLTCHRLAGL